RLVADFVGLRGYRGRPRRAARAAITARDDRRRPAMRLEEFGDPQHERRLAAAADAEVADDDHRNAGVHASQNPRAEKKPPHQHQESEHEARRPQQPREGAAAVPVPHYLFDCVVKVICDRPATRAASMTRTTDWCVAAASALITITGSLSAPPARRSSSASCSTLLNGTGLRLMTYCPWAFTSTAISFCRSGCFSACAVGRLICSSVYFEYVVVIMRKMRITIMTSMSGTRLISSGSRCLPRWKFIAARRRSRPARRGRCRRASRPAAPSPRRRYRPCCGSAGRR